MHRSEKEQIVSSLHEALKQAGLVVVTRQTGLTVAQSTDLRRQMRQAGANYRVVKNTLSRLAIAGTPYQGIAQMLSGPTAIAYSQDPVAAAKIAVKFAEKNEKFKVIGGGLGDEALGVEAVQALAKLPSLDELRGKLVGVLTAPMGNLVRVLQAPSGQLVRVIGAYGRS
ncbi:MAG: 50S ribosomal protein L10 [Pseudomonadota bacterium]